MPKKKPKKVIIDDDVEIPVYTTDLPPTPSTKPTPSKLQEWLRTMPPVIEGMPTQREYGEWLPKFKKWLEEGAKLA